MATMINSERDDSPYILIFGADVEPLRRHASESGFRANVEFSTRVGPDVGRVYNLDALVVTIMQAERFGLAGPRAEGVSSIENTPAPMVARGFPRYMIVGVKIPISDQRLWPREVRLLMSAALRAVNRFNSESSDRIQRVGVLAGNLMLEEIGPIELLKAVEDALREART